MDKSTILLWVIFVVFQVIPAIGFLSTLAMLAVKEGKAREMWRRMSLQDKKRILQRLEKEGDYRAIGFIQNL